VVELKLSANDLALLAPSIVPAQLMGFFTGVGKGMNPDQPKNLTASWYSISAERNRFVTAFDVKRDR